VSVTAAPRGPGLTRTVIVGRGDDAPAVARAAARAPGSSAPSGQPPIGSSARTASAGAGAACARIRAAAVSTRSGVSQRTEKSKRGGRGARAARRTAEDDRRAWPSPKTCRVGPCRPRPTSAVPPLSGPIPEGGAPRPPPDARARTAGSGIVEDWTRRVRGRAQL
jgi:hypothetical protein